MTVLWFSDRPDPPVTAHVGAVPSGLPDPDRPPGPPGEEQTVEQPSRVLRLAAMTQALVVQTQNVELDGAARHRLAAVYNHTVDALRELLSADLQGEIDRLELRLPEDPTDAELRVAQAQLLGWLEGLFHGIRTTVLASQMATEQDMARAYVRDLERHEQQAEARNASSYL